MRRLLLDTHLLVWAAADSPRFPETARKMLADADQPPVFSAASIWECAIKFRLDRDGISPDPRRLRRGLLEAGCNELPVTGEHGIATLGLPLLHRDPFDRILLAQAEIEGLTLLTSNQRLAAYPGPVHFVG